MEITVVVPFKHADLYTPIWANEESDIDFEKQYYRATRCTVSFAAIELAFWLQKILEKPCIAFNTRRRKGSFNIILTVNSYSSENQSFVLKPLKDGLLISAQGRIGLLYGAYEFLKFQDIRWFFPGKDGTYIPPIKNEIYKPTSIIKKTPAFARFRGFDFESASMESAELLLWMARNYLNLCGYRPITAPLAQKLGMKFKNGGHLFEELLHPNRVIETGKTLWETHPEWYGTPSNGLKSKEKALQTQFCVSNMELQKYLINHVLKLLKTNWRCIDILDVWGFDTWGSACCCTLCSKLGNGSDQMLYFLSNLRQAINTEFKKRLLKKQVCLSMCIYEGTNTLEPPQNPIPQNLRKAQDILIIYPINRCYAHSINDPKCYRNNYYHQHLLKWQKISKSMSLMVGEYYNVSRFEDLPVLFTHQIIKDLRYYKKLGFQGITYMHIPMVNWAIRTLTQNLYAELCWDPNINLMRFLKEFFSKYYGPFASKMQNAYHLIENAFTYLSDWRAWGNFSVLSRLQQWNGDIPVSPLLADACHSHFSTDEEAIESGEKSIFLLEKALKIIFMCISENRKKQTREINIETLRAVNPQQIALREQMDCYEKRLGEDRRLLIYGIHSFGLVWKLLCYYHYLYKNAIQEAQKLWTEIEDLADKMDCYYVPINYEWPLPGLVSRDALTRTQLRSVICGCRIQGKKIFKKSVLRQKALP